MAIKQRTMNLPQKAHFFLFGPRQVGKSTLIQQSYPKENSVIYNLLFNQEYTRLTSQPELLRQEVKKLDSNISHVIIDEVQRIPALLNEVHALIEDEDVKQFFVLTGSSARKLKHGQANLLAGRAWTRYLYPLSYQELGDDFDLQHVLQFGSLPSVYLTDDQTAHEILEAYVETYLVEEIKAEAIVRNIGAFNRFIKLAANESSNLLNYSNIAREASMSNQTVKEYFQILEDTLIGFFLQPYNKSSRKRLVKHPKFYLFDNGVRNTLLRTLSQPPQPKTYPYGIAFEHFIINEIVKLDKYYKLNLELSFYRNNNGAEVDLIIEKPNGEVLAVEIKSTENPNKADLKGLISFQDLVPEAQMICVSRAERERLVSDITIYPWRIFLDKLSSQG